MSQYEDYPKYLVNLGIIFWTGVVAYLLITYFQAEDIDTPKEPVIEYTFHGHPIIVEELEPIKPIVEPIEIVPEEE